MDGLSEEIRCIHDPVTDTLYACVSDLLDVIRNTADKMATNGQEVEASGVAAFGLGLLSSYEAHYENPMTKMVVEFFRNQN